MNKVQRVWITTTVKLVYCEQWALDEKWHRVDVPLTGIGGYATFAKGDGRYESWKTLAQAIERLESREYNGVVQSVRILTQDSQNGDKETTATITIELPPLVDDETGANLPAVYLIARGGRSQRVLASNIEKVICDIATDELQ